MSNIIDKIDYYLGEANTFPDLNVDKEKKIKCRKCGKKVFGISLATGLCRTCSNKKED